MKVLVVDDSYEVVETIMDYLELEGVTVDCAYNGESAAPDCSSRSSIVRQPS